MCGYLHRIQKIAITPFYSLRLKECNLKWKCQQRFWVQLFQISARQCFLDKYLRKRMIFFQLWLFCRLIVLRRYSGPPAGEPETPEHALITDQRRTKLVVLSTGTSPRLNISPSTKKDIITCWLFVTISRSQLNQIPQRLWLLKRLSWLW